MNNNNINKVHHSDFLDNQLPDKSVQLIIADPPYFEIKGDFDFSFESFEDYLKQVEVWAQEFKRILADNGTLLYWGNSKKIAYSQIIIDKYFNLINSCVWEKYDSILSCQEMSRSLRQHNERLLIYDKNIDMTGLEKIKLDMCNFQPLREYFKNILEFIGISKAEICRQVGTVADHCFRWGSSQWDMPIKETYQKIIKIYKIDKYKKFKEYEELRREYEDLRRPFNNILKLEEVLKYSQQSNVTKKYNHPTKKPERLTRDLIECCSCPDDLVFVPFAGSGTECAMARRAKRNFIGFDICKKYVEMSNKRIKYIEQTPTLF